jgi:hypothetical protein
MFKSIVRALLSESLLQPPRVVQAVDPVKELVRIDGLTVTHALAKVTHIAEREQAVSSRPRVPVGRFLIIDGDCSLLLSYLGPRLDFMPLDCLKSYMTRSFIRELKMV